jgi:membrane protease YdiL (CAAX protease family)
VSVIPLPVDYLLNSQNYVFAFNPAQWFLVFPIALILTPIQISAEEFFFRGYLLQGLGLLTRQRFVLIIVSSLLFAVPHFANPEMQRGAVWLALLYFAFGVFLTVITLKDNRLELALGVHAANNLRFLFISTKDSALPAPAIWIVNDPGDPRLDLVFFLIQSAIFYYVFFGRQKSNV